MTETYLLDGWTVHITSTQNGTIYDYQRTFTLSGAAENFDLPIRFPIQLNRIEYYSNDATAKSFTTRVFTGGVNTASYDQIVSLTNDTNLAVAYAGDISNKYIQSPIVIRTAVSASTAAKTLTKKVNVTKLE